MFNQSKSLFRRAGFAMAFALASLAGAPNADAQQSESGAPAREILDRYVHEAAGRNRGVAESRAAEGRAGAVVREARGRMLPSLGVNARYSEYSGTVNIGDFINPAYSALNSLVGEQRFPTNIDATLPQRQETRLELVQPLFAPALRAARQAAGTERDIAALSTAGSLRKLAADVQQAWLAVATADKVVETLASARVVLDENLRVSERLVSAGQATPDVVLRARAERSDVLQQIAEAERARAAARRGFNLLLDRDAESPIELASDSSLTPPATPTLEELEANAIARREELQQAGGYVRLADSRRRAAASAFLPTVALSASYGVQGEKYRFDRQNDVALASLVMSWNVFNGGQDAARRDQAAFARDEATARAAAAERAVRLDVRNAFDAVASARVATVAATDRLASAQRAFTLVERRYANGLATQVEFLSARSAYTAAALNNVITQFTLAARAVDLERAAATRALPE